LYFKIRPLESDLKVINGNSELGKHLRVSETPEILNAYFTDAGDKQRLRFCKLNEKLYFKVYATNFVGKKVKVHFITISDGYYRWKGMQLQDWENIKDYFDDENFFHAEEATFNDKGEILVEVPLSKLGTPKKHFLINGAIELPAEEGKKPKGVYVEMADRAFIFKTNANAEELKNAPAPLIVDRVNIDTGDKKHEDGKCPRCGVLTIEEINKIFTTASTENKINLMNAFNEGNLKFEIDTCLKKAHFFAQVLQEVGTSLKLNEPESFNYSARRLKDGDFVSGSGWVNGNKATGEGGHYTSGTWKSSPFSYFKTHHSEADKYGRKDLYSYNDKGIQSANSEAIANIVYADKNRGPKYKLGNIYEGDGWKFMGKGIIQVTGRTNYSEVNKRLEKKGFNFNIINNSNILLNHREGVLASMAYWYWKDLQIKSEEGQTRKNVDTITNIVNEGTDTHQKRWDNFVKILGIFRVNECEKDKQSTNESQSPCKDDYSQCISYADVWENPIISSDNGGKNNNRFGHGSTRGHKGLDILSGSEYKDVHSTMCGEVVSIVDSFKTNEYRKSSLGNTVMIKSKDKENKTVFMLYCHLDEIYVKKGDKVCHGQKIALSGSTGNAAEILDAKGNLKNGIRKENWHVHIEAATKGDGYNNFYSLGSYRIQPENYMKTKFDENGEPIK
jgi:predicted chitinase